MPIPAAIKHKKAGARFSEMFLLKCNLSSRWHGPTCCQGLLNNLVSFWKPLKLSRVYSCLHVNHTTDYSPINDNDNGNKIELLRCLNEILPRKKTCSVIEVDATLPRAGRESLGLRVGE